MKTCEPDHKRTSIFLNILRANWRNWLPSRGNVIFTLVVIVALFWAQSAHALPWANLPAAANSTIIWPYQGRLNNSVGIPLTAAVPMTFRLYSTSSGGTALWQEQWTSVQVTGGLFNVMLGSLAAIPQSVVSNNNNLWLGITVGTDSEMVPRVQLGSVPFAGTVSDGSVTTAKIADGAVTSSKLSPTVIVARHTSDFDDVASTSSLTWVNLPLSLPLTLQSASQVLVSISCQARNNIADSGTGLRIMDGTNSIGGVGRHDSSTVGRIGTVLVQDIVTLSPGNHTLQAQFLSYISGLSFVRHCVFYAFVIGQPQQ